jgi:hypothetical protein
MKKQTAIEWLEDNIDSGMPYREILMFVERAKKMEKEQIMDAYNQGDYGGHSVGAEKYFILTFKK